ncbi:MAG: hypothetical protein ACIAQZ_08580 [Sedimentisphaeraceae bacterium JB056]
MEYKNLPQTDIDVLRSLGEKKAEIAALDIQKKKAQLWTNLNDKKGTRPLLWMDEVPWHEVNYNDELTNQCQNDWARNLETKLLREIYQWKHMPCDMVIANYISCPMVIEDPQFGIIENVETVGTDPESNVVSRHFNVQITNPEDIEKITMPEVIHHSDQTEENYNCMKKIFDGIIPVRKEGISWLWYTPWDMLIRWWGVEQAMMDMVLRPEMVHAAVERMVDNYIHRIDQYERLGLLTLDNTNHRVGSGGYAYTSELASGEPDWPQAKTKQLWGCSNAQIFSEISPEMHWEFAVKHDLRWLEKWGMNYYGCCEPLDKKIDVLRNIPNLRKISMSPWIDVDNAAKQMGTDYVFSYKFNPAFMAESQWDSTRVEKELSDILERTKGCHVEVILKDISTVRYEPKRLWDYAAIAARLSEKYT